MRGTPALPTAVSSECRCGRISFSQRRARQEARPRIEDLHGIRARGGLLQQVLGHEAREAREQLVEQRRLRGRERAQRREILRALAFDEIGRERPRRAAEAEQRRFFRQRRTRQLQRLDDLGRDLRRIGAAQALDGCRIANRIGDDGAGIEIELDAERGHRAHDVRKDDRRVERIALERHQRDFGRELRIARELLEAVLADGTRGTPAGSGPLAA